MALTKLKTSGIADDAVTTDKLANAINTERTANTAKVQTTINNNADNRVITGSGTANTLEGESGLTYDGNDLNISVGAHDSGMAITAANNNQETRLTITGKHSDGTSHSFLLNAKRSANRLDIVGGGSARISVDANGYVGINQASPSSELQVGGGTNPMTAKPTFHVAPSSGNAAMSLRGGSPSIYFDGTGGGHTRFLTDGTDIAISNGNLDSAGNERFRFRADGGLCFNGDTAAANALDDYEEGTWTAALTAGETCTSARTSYTKIGRLVTVYAYINNFSDFNGNSSTFEIGGLPFAIKNEGSYHGGGSISYADTFNYSYPLLMLGTQGGTTIYFHRQDGTAATWKYQDFHNTSNGGSNGHLIVQFAYETSA